MPTVPFAAWMLEQEARALLTRLERVKPFALHETMLPAANILPTAQTAIERYLIKGRRELKDLVSVTSAGCVDRRVKWRHQRRHSACFPCCG